MPHLVHHNEGDPLSVRELEVLRLTARGLTSKEIGLLLSISYRTIETHRRSTRLKLGARTSAEMVGIAYETGILVPQRFMVTPVELG